MKHPASRLASALLAAALTGPALAAAPVDGPVTTEPSARTLPPASDTTLQQIDHWLTDGQAAAAGAPKNRKLHGSLSLGVGTGGYREASAVVQGPLGEHGEATIAVDMATSRTRLR